MARGTDGDEMSMVFADGNPEKAAAEAAAALADLGQKLSDHAALVSDVYRSWGCSDHAGFLRTASEMRANFKGEIASAEATMMENREAQQRLELQGSQLVAALQTNLAALDAFETTMNRAVGVEGAFDAV